MGNSPWGHQRRFNRSVFPNHIKPKEDEGGEDITNLIVLCPNCHTKKTKGVIEIDPETKVVKELGKEIIIKDNHLELK